MKHFIFPLICIFFLQSCSVSYHEDGRQIRPERKARYNMTDATVFLQCVGGLIDKSPNPGTDFFIARLRDQTRPFDTVGLLALETTMMASIAMDRLGTPKIRVVGGSVEGMPEPVQLIGAFTELNRTITSGALGGALRLDDIAEIDLSADQEWNNIALDMALVYNTVMLNGMTASVNISVEGDSGDGNFIIAPGEEYSGVISMGYRGREGIHAAQRLLIETAIGILMGKFYDVDMTQCIGEAGRLQNDHKLYAKDQVFNKDGRSQSEIEDRTGHLEQKPVPVATPETTAPSLKNDVSVEDPPASTASPATLQTKTTGGCLFSIDPEIKKRLPNKKWKARWEGKSCAGGGRITDLGSLILEDPDTTEILMQYDGMMKNGLFHGWGTLEIEGFEYKGYFIRGIPSQNGNALPEQSWKKFWSGGAHELPETPKSNFKSRYLR